MKYIFLILILVLFSGCGSTGGPQVNWYDGTWSMCKTTKDGELVSNIPFPTGNLPPGVGANIKGVVIECTPIPMKPQPTSSAEGKP